MDLNRRVCDRIYFMVLLLRHIVAATVLPGINQTNGFNLDCTHDIELMVCQLELQNCTEYSMIFLNLDGENCTLQQCGTGKCCCTFKSTFTIGMNFTAKVLKDGQIMESKDIGVRESFKPKTPTIISVEESNGNFEVKWTSNTNGFINEEMTAEVTYYKKGETRKITKFLKPATVNGLTYYEINGQHLEPSSTYVVSVKSFTTLNDKCSESSREVEFKTPSSLHSQLVVIIISLSIAAVIFSVAIYVLHSKLKTKLWKDVPKPPNEILNTNSIEQQILKPEPPITYSVSIEPLIPDDSRLGSKMSLTDTSSGIGTASSDPSYANTGCPAAVNGDPPIVKATHDVLSKTFPNIRPIPPLATTESNSTQESGLIPAPCHPFGIQAKDLNSGSSGFENKTYFDFSPSCVHQTLTNNLEVQVKAEMPCDSEYHPSKSDMSNCPFQQVPACEVPAQQGAILPQVVSPLVSTDISYQVVPTCVPKGSHSFPVVDDDCQAFPSQVRQPHVLLLEQRNREHKEHLDKWEEKPFIKTPESILSPVVPVQDGQRVSELQIPFPSLVSSMHSKPLITVSDYQSI